MCVLYLCLCVCVYVCVCEYAYVCLCMCAYVYVFICVCVCVNTYQYNTYLLEKQLQIWSKEKGKQDTGRQKKSSAVRGEQAGSCVTVWQL
jgi:hypothetical protein